MGLREEIREELEEKEKYGNVKNNMYVETPPINNSDDDKDFRGIGWNILYRKFIEGE